MFAGYSKLNRPGDALDGDDRELSPAVDVEVSGGVGAVVVSSDNEPASSRGKPAVSGIRFLSVSPRT